MTITAWRIVKTRLAAGAFTGEGARLHGGRWNSPGRRVVYTAQSVSLALLEMLVHVDSSLLPRYSVFPVSFDGELVASVDPSILPGDWRAYPGPQALRMIGNRWLDEGATAVLRVPSAVVPQESNYLLNPVHPRFASVKIGEARTLTLDLRLLEGGEDRTGR